MSDQPERIRSLFLSKHVLQGYGCKSCIWKSYGQCPKGYIFPEESEPEGYCQEMADFLFGLAEKSDSVSAIKEKFMLYTQEMQAMADHMKFQLLVQKYDKEKKLGKTDKELAELITGIQMYKMWWNNLTFSITKGLSRIVDRERRSEDVDKTVSKVSIHNFNVLLKESDEKLKQLEKGDPLGKEGN